MEPLDALIEERFVKASGPGGQNVNKVSSAVQLRYLVEEDHRLTDSQKTRLHEIAGQRITQTNVLLIDAREYRSQDQNRVAARARLKMLLEQAVKRQKRRRPTKPSLGARQRRLDGKTNRSRVKQTRRRPNLDD